MRVLIVVTHLLGAGHLSRALTLGRAFAKAGHDVQIASGGMPAPQFDSAGLTLLQLPPLRSDGVNFTRLLTPDGGVADATYLDERATQLCAIAAEFAPDIALTELFPFGRRVLRIEFLALLQTLRKLPRPPVVLASVRDILAPPSKPEKAAQTARIIEEFYDGVLVHSDPTTTTLDQSWPVSDAFASRLIYTGYVAPQAASKHPQSAGRGEIIVSAGGGSVGGTLFETAIRAAALDETLNWRLLVGGQDAATRVLTMKKLSRSNLTIEPARPDFRQMLHHAACSVSLCGYNTALDILQADVPAIFVPFDDGGETEQTIRASSLSQMPAISMISNDDLTPPRLLEHVRQVSRESRSIASGLHFDGADQSVDIACQLVRAKA